MKRPFYLFCPEESVGAQNVVERLFTRHALFKTDEGAASVSVGDRNIDPLQAAHERQVRILRRAGIVEPDNKEIIRDLGWNSDQRIACRLFRILEGDALNIVDGATGKPSGTVNTISIRWLAGMD